MDRRLLHTLLAVAALVPALAFVQLIGIEATSAPAAAAPVQIDATSSDSPAVLQQLLGDLPDPKPAEVRYLDGERVNALWQSLLIAARYSGWRGQLNSGLRRRGEQARLYGRYLRGRGAPAFAPDGPSRHMRGNLPAPWALAVDVTHARELVWVAGQRLGVTLERPYAGEPWHVEAAAPFSFADLRDR